MVEPVFFESAAAFERWLEAHCEGVQEVWVGYYRKASGREALSWSASVDVALAFGWIDGVRRSVDGQRYMIRFTPRRPGSVWSAVNVRKAEALIAGGRMRPEGLRLFKARRDREGYSARSRAMSLDPALEARIRANDAAWTFFTGLAPSYRRDSIWWVMSARREETRHRRLDVLIDAAAEGLKIPMLRK